MTTTLKALALYNNEGDDTDELSFKINDLLTILTENWQDGWHLCQVNKICFKIFTFFGSVFAPIDSFWTNSANLILFSVGREEGRGSSKLPADISKTINQL